MARTKKTASETTRAAVAMEIPAPKRRGRPPKHIEPAAVASKPVKTAAQPEVAPRRRGRPPKQPLAVPEKVDKKPGLVSMAPATSVKADRKKTLLHELSIEPRGRGRPPKKVMPVQQEQIIAEELHSKVVHDKGSAKIPKASVGRPPKVSTPAAVPPVKAGRGAAAQAVSLPPATVQARKRRKLRALSVVAIILLLAGGAGGYVYKNRHVEAAEPADTRLIQDVGARVVLPAGETPSISTVVDASQVNQPFLEGAKNGDKVLLFFQSGRAIVYRPSTGQIVNMGTLQEPRPRVFIRKGASNADTSKISAEVTAGGTFTVASQDVSPRGNYSKTIVVDVAGNRPDIANKLADALHASVSKLPAGETPPDVDLLVIVGSDNPTK